MIEAFFPDTVLPLLYITIFKHKPLYESKIHIILYQFD